MDKAGKNAVKRIGKVFLFIIIVSLLFTLGIFVFLTRTGVSIVAIKGDSMVPTFKNNDTIVLLQEDVINRNQIAIVKKPRIWYDYETKENLIKRVVGVPGDEFYYDGNSILINDKVIIDIEKEGYNCSDGKVGYKTKIEQGKYLILGDNHTNSLDSIRVFCDGDEEKMFIPRKNIENFGEIRFVL